MAFREILKYPDERLEKVSAPVQNIDDSVRKLLDDMAETMYAAEGVGLAASQVGEHVRVLVIDLTGVEDNQGLLKIINPVIVSSVGKGIREEGCLSLPELKENVERAAEIVVRFLDEEGRPVELKCGGILARAIQHEIDHLNGILILNHLSTLKKSLAKRRLIKAKKKALKD